jgi:hypothetical protein
MAHLAEWSLRYSVISAYPLRLPLSVYGTSKAPLVRKVAAGGQAGSSMRQSCWRSSQQRSRLALGLRSAEQTGVLVAFATEPAQMAQDLGNAADRSRGACS